MNTLIEFLGSYWLRILGETLLHSLWQGFLIMAIVVVALRIIPIKESNVRYRVASLGLLLVVVVSIATFISMYKPMTNSTAAIQKEIYQYGEYAATSIVGLYVGNAKAFIHTGLPFFLLFWISGSAFFILRTVTALVYVEKIKRGSILLQNEWTGHIQRLAAQFNISCDVQLAESSAIHAPIIFGYLKPMILIPIGMCTALSTQQLETIFLHEMMHIRRKDYLVNLIQTWVEAMYFFNPFIWMISSIIRQEREHCCDDAVIKFSGNAKEYARALATLEEVRLSNIGVSISLATNKNQLLKRIKRLMEKSVKNYSTRDRIAPVLLIVIGLLCASWVSTHAVNNIFLSSNVSPVLSDTTKKAKKNKLKREASPAPSDENEKTETARTPENNEDKESEALPADDNSEYTKSYPPYPNGNISIPIPPDFDMDITLPPIPDVNAMMHSFEGQGLFDGSGKEWQQFGKEFEESFRAKFSDFYEMHDEEIQQMLADVEDKVAKSFGKDWQRKIEDFAAKQQQWSADHANRLERQAEKFKTWEQHHLKNFEEGQQAFRKQMEAFGENNRRFQEELKTELINDGYLREDEQLENIHWRNSQIEINGKPIKAEHEKKYNDLRHKYFSDNAKDGEG